MIQRRATKDVWEFKILLEIGVYYIFFIAFSQT